MPRKAKLIISPLMWTIFSNRSYFIAKIFLEHRFYPHNFQFIPQNFCWPCLFLVIDHKLCHLCTEIYKWPCFTRNKCKMIIFTQKKCTLVGWKKPSKKAKILARESKILRSVWKSQDLGEKAKEWHHCSEQTKRQLANNRVLFHFSSVRFLRNVL